MAKISNTETFSYKVKSETASNITGRKRSDACLLGMLLFCNTLETDNIVFQTENDVCRDLFIRMVTHATENEKAVAVTEIKKRGRPRLYSLRIDKPSDRRAVFERVGIDPQNPSRYFKDNRLPKEKDLGAFVAGAFLACGSVLHPEREYHLEFVMGELSLCNDLGQMFIDRLGIIGKYTQRRSSHILYLKESEHIEDVLTLIGATLNALEIMNVKILKDIRNHVNRAANCDMANAEKQSRSSERQIKAIQIIEQSEGGLSRLSDELREIAEMRLENPDFTLAEIAEAFDPPLSRSGANHRFKRLEQIAEELLKSDG